MAALRNNQTMADYPAAIFNQRTVENLPGVTYDEENTKTFYAEDFRALGDEVSAIETTLGTDPQGSESTVGARIAAVESDVEDIPGLITSSIASAIAAAKAALYPIGSIYTNASDSTNPATLLGFGTWSAFAAGRVMVGKNTSGTFGTAGATGGAETHTLTSAEMPAHSHDGAGGFEVLRIKPSGGLGVGGGTNVGAIYNSVQGGGGAHNNLQPYIVVFMWRRTA